jgi:hypothetical protein
MPPVPPMPDEQRRNAERITLKEPIVAKIGDMEVRIIEISLIGGRIEHIGRLAMNANVTLHFRWSGEKIQLRAKVARTEMRSVSGKTGYSSGVDFAKTPEEAPATLQRIIASFLQKAEPPPPPPPPPPVFAASTPVPFLPDIDDDFEEIGAEAEVLPYVRCVWEEEQWVKDRTRDPKQPMQGFTMLAPESEDEIDDFCRTYEVADPETQRMIRLSFELAIAQDRRK